MTFKAFYHIVMLKDFFTREENKARHTNGMFRPVLIQIRLYIPHAIDELLNKYNTRQKTDLPRKNILKIRFQLKT